MFTIADKGLIAFLAILTIFSYSMASGGRQGVEIRIEAGGKQVGTHLLRKDSVFDVKGALGTSRISIRSNKASFLSSPCRNKVCVHQGEIGKNGQMAACLPNKVVIRALGGDGDYDAVTR
ncbi:MAG: NusG domain II-containing protein [Deltaproteobacteria bacterium]|nr:NusG domain II-containing protein [Deltaproteobacteria bacterium]